MTKAAVLILGVLAAIGPASCRERPVPAPVPADANLRVFVSIPPQAYFVERIGGEHVQVEVLVGPGQSPHTFAPTPRKMTRLAQARLLFRVGVPFEETLVAKLASTHGRLKIVDTRKGIELRRVQGGHAGHEHRAGETDPHVWLSPRLAKVQARTMCDALCEADPAHAGDYRENLAALHADLDRLDRRIAAALAPLKGRTFYVFHPAFAYFGAAYGLKQQAVETGGKAPGPRHVKALIDKARAEGVKVIFVQPQFSDREARTVADQIGGAVVPMDPLARDYINNLEDMAAKVRAALGQPGKPERPAPPAGG